MHFSKVFKIDSLIALSKCQDVGCRLKYEISLQLHIILHFKMHLWADFEILFCIAAPLILQVVSSNENQQQTL